MNIELVLNVPSLFIGGVIGAMSVVIWSFIFGEIR